MLMSLLCELGGAYGGQLDQQQLYCLTLSPALLTAQNSELHRSDSTKPEALSQQQPPKPFSSSRYVLFPYVEFPQRLDRAPQNESMNEQLSEILPADRCALCTNVLWSSSGCESCSPWSSFTEISHYKSFTLSISSHFYFFIFIS